MLTDALQAVSATLWPQCAATVALLIVVYYCLFTPVDSTKDLCDEGFEHSVWGASRKTRTALMRDVLRNRRVDRLPPVYPNGWFAVLESCRLASTGAVQHVSALGQNLAVFRGESGRVHVLDAYCPHLGANMAVGGSVRGECLVCPFHEWRFDGHDGKCTAVPYAQKVPDFAKVRRWESREMNGFVFVWHHAEGEPPDWEPQPVGPVEDGSLTYGGRYELRVACHIQDIHENAADVAHFGPLHGPGIGKASPFVRHLWESQWTPGDSPHSATLKITTQFKLNNKICILKQDIEAHQIGPGYVEIFIETGLGPIVVLMSATPIEPLLQRVIHRMYCPRLLIPVAKIILYAGNVMFERDANVWSHKQFLDKPLLVKEDYAILRYRRWFSQFYSENSPKHTFRKETLEW